MVLGKVKQCEEVEFLEDFTRSWIILGGAVILVKCLINSITKRRFFLVEGGSISEKLSETGRGSY